MTEAESAAVYETTQEFLEDHDDSEVALESVLAVDSEQETWKFDDIPLDSGTFGELVSSGIVEKTEDSYRLVDHDAVSSALHGDSFEGSPEDTEDTRERNSLRSILSIRHGLLGVGLLLTGLLRSVFHYSDVFRDGTTVLPGNDPYRRRYWLERLVESDLQPWNPLDVASMPKFVTVTDAFFYWLMWTAAAVLGNSPDSVSLVLAWYPVVAAMATGLAVYLLAIRVTGDVRIGIASVFMLSIVPIHASYTALGMGDHHALDYLLLTLIIGSVVVIVDDADAITVAGRELSATWVGVLGLGATLAWLNAAWRGSPLWLAGLGLYALVQVNIEYYRGRSPVPLGAPILAGTVLAGALTLLFRFGFGWLQPYRVVAPLLLAAGIGIVLGASEVARRLDISKAAGVAAPLVLGGFFTTLAWLTVPPVSENTGGFWTYLQRTNSGNITETASLFSPELGVIGGPISYVGGVFVLAIPVLIWATWVAVWGDRPKWVVVAVFGWYLFGWATVQIRFTAEFAPLIALFAGIGFIFLLSWVDLLPPPAILGDASTTQQRASSDSGSLQFDEWSPSTVAYIGGFFLFISIFAFIFIPSFAADITVDDDTYETARWIEEYSDEQGYDYPENYVFTPWSENRQYNYYVNGESDKYDFAQDNYDEFLTSSDPDNWYADLRSRGRFVVTHDRDLDTNGNNTYSILHDRLGSGGDNLVGADHYRALYATANRQRVVFELVDGARLTGTGPANATTELKTEIEASGLTFDYRREVETNRYGDYGITIPYPGEYELLGTPFSVSDEDARTGAFLSPYRSHWTFDEGSGTTISDPVGGATATIDTPEWVDGVRGSALRYTGDGATVIRDDPAAGIANESFSVSFWIKGATSTETDSTLIQRRNAYSFWIKSDSDRLGFRVGDIDGNGAQVPGIDSATLDEWTLITGVFDREAEELRLYRNTTLVSARNASQIGPVRDLGPLSFGGEETGNYASAALDSVRFYSAAIGQERLDELYRDPQRPD